MQNVFGLPSNCNGLLIPQNTSLRCVGEWSGISRRSVCGRMTIVSWWFAFDRWECCIDLNTGWQPKRRMNHWWQFPYQLINLAQWRIFQSVNQATLLMIMTCRLFDAIIETMLTDCPRLWTKEQASLKFESKAVCLLEKGSGDVVCNLAAIFHGFSV